MNIVDVSTDNFNNKTIIIDAGHGGVDGGTNAADGTLEKDINLQIAYKLNDLLNSMGIKTVMTRTEDVSLHNSDAHTIRQKKISDLNNRLDIINNTDDSVFVSIHQNYFTSSEYYGSQVFYSKNNSESDNLASSIRLSIISYLQTDNNREIKASGSEIFLLNNSTVPSVMVECGFLSNENEANKLKNGKYQQELAFAVALGIVDYLKNTEG